ncbi:MAG: hypothetical protein IPJ41_14055 [Phycisphaerales bacterium]|nr:hypothetical protein [Phycisphaerales bacterium]
MQRFSFCLVLLLGCLAPAAAGQSVPLTNPGFESGPTGAMPEGWSLRPQSSPDFAIVISGRSPAEGHQCLSMRYSGQAPPTGRTWAAVEQSVDAAAVAGRRLRLSGRVRTEATETWGGGGLWLRITRADGSVLFTDNMRQRLVRDEAWTDCTIDADVPDGAAKIAVGGLLVGGGDAWFDDLSLTAIGNTPKPAPPRALSERGQANLCAFARALGVVRYFNADAAGAAIDWDAFTAAALPAVESAPDATSLRTCLNDVLGPVAPGLRIRVTGERDAPSPSRGDGQLRQWVYHGYGMPSTGQPNLYWRKLIEVPAASLDDHDLFWRADLPAGVSCDIPLATPDAEPIADPGAVSVASANDRWTRLADVITLWNVMAHFHPYLTQGSCDWDDALGPALQHAAIDDSGAQFLRTLREMTRCLGDGHVFVASEGEDLSGSLPLAWRWLGDDLVVTGVGDPLSGITLGDRVLSIDGQGALDALQSVQTQISGSPQWVREQAPRLLLMGRAGSTVELQLEAPNGEARKAVVRRRAGRSAPEPRPEPITEIKPGVWYVDLTRTTDGQLDDALDKIAAGTGVIFDLRGYPRITDPLSFFGHLSATALTSAHWQVPVLTKPFQDGKTFGDTGQWEIAPAAPFFPAKRVFLTDGRAISFAESCLEIVKHFGLARIVGAPTAGANGNVIRVALAGGFQVTFTGMLVEHLDGSRLFGLGILPDTRSEPTRQGIASGRDEVLEAGLAALAE